MGNLKSYFRPTYYDVSRKNMKEKRLQVFIEGVNKYFTQMNNFEI